MRNIVALIVLFDFRTLIIVINIYISFSRYISMKNTLISIYKIFVNVVL